MSKNKSNCEVKTKIGNKTLIEAYAKINLHLDVTEIRTDGYHNIQSIMQSVSLCDIIEIEIIAEQNIIIECDKPGVPLDEKNIAYRAAKRFFDNAEIALGAIIKIQKNIPMAAGLAGGSADGAAVLVALNNIFDKLLPKDELYAIGSSLGADVPFCMACGCCYTGGIGDKLIEIEPLNDKSILVIACGGEGVSTPMAYRMIDEKYNNFIGYEPKSYKMLSENIAKENSDFYKYIFNIFEEPIMCERPTVKELKSFMLNNGACGAMMSGSGPSVFGVFKSLDFAKKAVKILNENGYFAAIAYPTGKR